MMQEYTNALYVDEIDPTAAVIYDRGWVQQTAREAGLSIVHVVAPSIRGNQWVLVMAPSEGAEKVEIPPDEAPYGSSPPPDMPPAADRIGLDEN
jgi:hypothetical protein